MGDKMNVLFILPKNDTIVIIFAFGGTSGQGTGSPVSMLRSGFATPETFLAGPAAIQTKTQE